MGPIETMTYAAACNERLRLGCAVRDLESVPVFGPPRACVDGLHEMIEAGAEMILLNPLFDEAEQMERLAADVMPRMLE
ncbi:MAG TPA: hypothetical protein VGZ23_04845 [bacterium]|nr:hypothetical protein [bacterium]